jgi:hypothetical protein
VQAPQFDVSQPTTVPVLPSCSRRYYTSRVRFSTSSEYATPSTVTLIRVMLACPPMSPSDRAPLRGRHVRWGVGQDNLGVSQDTRAGGHDLRSRAQHPDVRSYGGAHPHWSGNHLPV